MLTTTSTKSQVPDYQTETFTSLNRFSVFLDFFLCVQLLTSWAIDPLEHFSLNFKIYCKKIMIDKLEKNKT